MVLLNIIEGCLELAYENIKCAFEYYMENYNDGRPIVVAGFSQGDRFKHSPDKGLLCR